MREATFLKMKQKDSHTHFVTETCCVSNSFQSINKKNMVDVELVSIGHTENTPAIFTLCVQPVLIPSRTKDRKYGLTERDSHTHLYFLLHRRKERKKEKVD